MTNEAALDREDASDGERANLRDLRLFKEKLVGRKLTLFPVAGEAYDAFVGHMTYKDARVLAGRDRQTAIGLFHTSRRGNLRSLRMGFEAFDRLVPHFEAAWLERAEAMRDILLGCLFVALEHAAGADPEVLAHPARGRFSHLLAAVGGRREPSPVEAEAERILAQYQDHPNLESPPIPMSILLDLVAEGRMDAEALRKVMAGSPMVVGEAKAPPWRIMFDVSDLDVDRSRRAVERARQQFETLSVTEQCELLHLAGIMLRRADHGDLGLSEGQPVVTFIEAYLDRLRESGTMLRHDLRPFAQQHLSAHGYVVTGAEAGHDDLLRIATLVHDAILGSIRRKFPEFRARLLADLAASGRDLSLIATEGDLRLALELPLFEGWEVAPFADLIMRQTGFDRRALQWLANGRYEPGPRLASLAAEADWFERLRDELRARIAEAEPPFRSFWRETLDAVAEPALRRLRGQEPAKVDAG